MTVPITDTISRTALIGVYEGDHRTVHDALAAHAGTGIAIVADPSVCADVAGQAALCTAVATAVRAFGTVTVVTGVDTVLVAGPHQGRTLGEAITTEGAHLAANLRAIPAQRPALLIGAPTSCATGEARPAVLRTTWTGWTARVQPAGRPAPAGRPGTVLAAIAAGALGVHEAFGEVRNRPGSDAGYRTVQLNLWHPGSDIDDGPELTHAPAAWWLVGLGHLGQAYAWVISWLTYADPSTVQIVLQDTDRTVEANHSTGMLTPPRPPRIRKPRIVAAALDPLGFDTVLLERRLDATSRVTDTDVHVALIGVDNLPTRRLISTVGWPLAIDAGLGTGPADFNAILLRRFPAAVASHQVPGWAEPRAPARKLPQAPALNALEHDDGCGMAELAGTAVGAAFVGVTTACLTITEAVRAVLGGNGYDIINLHLQSGDLNHAPATEAADVIPARLS